MAHSPDDRRALFQRVVDDIRDQIRTGHLEPEALVPSANQLSETYGIAQMTAQRALRELQNQGLIYAIQGRGTYVHPAAATRLRQDQRQAPAVPVDNQAAHDREQARLDTALATVTRTLTEARASGDVDALKRARQNYADALTEHLDQHAELAAYRLATRTPTGRRRTRTTQ